MAISIKSRDVVNFNAVGPTGGPKKDQYLDFVDDAGTTQASLYVPGSGATPTFSVDNAPVGGVQTVYSASVTLTDAQIKALPTTPFELAPAQGANIQIVPMAIYGTIDATAGAYTNITDGAGVTSGGNGLLAVFGDDDSDASTMAYTGLLSFPGVRRFTLIAAIQSVTGDSAIVDGADNADQTNKALNLITRNADGAFGGGNAANSLKVTTLYTVVDLS